MTADEIEKTQNIVRRRDERIASLEAALSEIRDICAARAAHDRIAGVAMIALAGRQENATMDVKTHHGLRDVEITCATGDEVFTVERMFDGKGSETFDPTDAVEVDGDGSFHRLEAGDVVTIRVRVEE